MFVLLITPKAVAHETKAQDQKPAAATETSKQKNEVDRLLEEAAKRGETVLVGCVSEDCVKDSAQITAGVERGKALHLATPSYPNIARKAKAEGEVKVQIIIDGEGKVIAAAAISGHPLLYGVSVKAARETTFTPTLLYGKPVKVTGVLTYNFVGP